MNRDEQLHAAVAEAICQWHEAFREGEPNPCAACKDTAEEWLEVTRPLIEADLRERLAGEIEAQAGALMQPHSEYIKGYWSGLHHAAASVRGASADTDPTPDNTTERTQT